MPPEFKFSTAIREIKDKFIKSEPAPSSLGYELGKLLIKKNLDVNLLRSHLELLGSFQDYEVDLEQFKDRPNVRFANVDIGGEMITPTSLTQVIEIIANLPSPTIGDVNTLLFRLLDNCKLQLWLSDPQKMVYRYADSEVDYGGSILPSLSRTFPYIEKSAFEKGKSTFWAIDTPDELYAYTDGQPRHLFSVPLADLEKSGILTLDVGSHDALLHISSAEQKKLAL